MSATIDEKVVQMKFDNSNFEKNVKTSMSTLDKLKDALNFNSAKDSVKTLNDATKSIDFSSMSRSIDTISDRFSALGIVGMTVIQNLTNSAMNLAKSWASIIPEAVIQGGWKRATDVEQARFTLQGVVRDEQEVAAVMQDAKDSVDGTAYAYNEAAKAASVFAASGLRSGEQMQKVLKAVAGTAATANADYEGIAHIFQTVAGQGRVMGEQLNQFASRGINAAATIADYFNAVNSGTVEASEAVDAAIFEITGGIETNEADIRDWASKSLISFDIFSEAMATTFGDHAKDANKTFSGAMANIRAALARTGESFFKHLIEQEGPAVQLFNSIRLKINQMNSVLDESAESAANFVNSLILKFRDAVEDFPIMTITKTILNFFKILRNVAQPIIQIFTTMGKAFSDAFDFGNFAESVFNLSENLVKLTETFKFSAKNVESMRFAFKGVFDAVSLLIDGLRVLIDIPIGQFTNPLQGLLDIMLNVLGTIGLTLTKITVGIRQSEKVRDAIDSLTDAFGKIYDVFHGAWVTIVNSFARLGINIRAANSGIADFIANLAVKTVEKFADLISIIANALSTIAEKIGPKLNEVLESVIFKISDLVSRFKAFAKENDLGTKALQGFVTILKVIAGLIVAPIYAIYRLVTAIAELPIVQQALSKLADTFKMVGNFALRYLEIAGDKIWQFIGYMENFDFKTFMSDLKDKLSELGEKFGAFLDKASEGEGIISKFAEALKKAWENFKLLTGGVSAHTLYDEYGEPIEDAEEKTNTFGDTIRKVKDHLKAFFDTIDINMVIVAIFAGTMIAMVLAIKKLVDGFTGLVSSVKGVADAISGFLNSWKRKEDSKIIEFAKAILILAGALFVISKIEPGRLLPSLGAMAAMFVGLVVVAGLLTKFSKSIKKNDAGKEIAALAIVLVSFSASMILLAGALKIMETIDFGSAMRGVVVLGTMGAIVAGLTIAVTRFSKVGSIKQALVIVAFAFAMGKFADAIANLANVNYENISENLKSLVVVFGMLSILALASSKIGLFSAVGLLAMLFFLDKMMPMINSILKESNFGKIFDDMMAVIRKNIDMVLVLGTMAAVMAIIGGAFGKGFKKFGTGMLLLSISVLILGKAIDMIGAIDPLKIEKGISTIERIYKMFALLGLVLSIGNGANGAIKIAAAIGIMSLCLYPIAGAIWVLGTMDSKKVEQGKKAVEELMMCFAIIVAASKLGSGKATFGAVMAVVIGILGLVAEMVILTLIPTDKLETAVKAIGTVMLAFSAVLLAASKIGDISEGFPLAAILAAVVGVLAITGMLIALSYRPWDQMLAAGASMTLVLLAFSHLVNVMGKLDLSALTGDKAKAILAAGLVLIELGAALYLASLNPWQQILSGALGMTVTMLAFGKLLQMMSDVRNGFDFNMERAKALLVAGLFLGEIAAALYVLSLNPWQNLLAATVAMGVTLFTFSQVMESVARTTFDVKKAGALLLAGLVMGEVALALYFLAQQPWENMLAGAVSLSAVLIAFAVALKLTSGMDPMVAAKAALSLIVFIGIIELVLGAVTYLIGRFLTDQAYQYIQRGFQILAAIGRYIGIAIGEFIGGIGVGLTNNLPAIADNLTAFSDHIMPFVENMSKIGDDVFKGAAALAKSLLVLTGSNLLQSLAEFFGARTMQDFGAQIGAFGEGIAAFATATENINAEAVETAANAGTILAYLMRALPNEGGILAKWVGDNTIDKFNSTTLGGFGEGIKAFADAVSDLNTDDVEAAVSAGLSLSYLMKALPNEGGYLADIIGDNSIKLFTAETLGGFGEGIMAFAVAVKDLDTDAITAAASAGLSLAYLMKALPNEGGILAEWLGDNTIDKFNKTTLGGFGEGLAAFAEQVKNINGAVVEKAANAGLMLAKLMKALPNEGGAAAWWAGENSITQFTKETLGKFGEGIASFADAVSGITEDHVTAATNAYKVMKRMVAIDLPNEGGFINAIKGFFAGKKDAEKFKEKMKLLSEALKVFYDNTKDLDIERLKTTFKVLESLSKTLEVVNATDSSTIQNFAKKLKAAGDLGIKAFCDQFEGTSDKISSAVSKFLNNMASEFKKKSNIKILTDAMDTAISAMVAEGNTKASDFKSVSNNITANIANGISSGKGNAVNTASDFADSIFEPLNDQLGYDNMFNMMDGGMDGLYDGIDLGSFDVLNSSDELSTDMFENIQSQLGYDNLENMMDGGLDGIKDSLNFETPSLSNLSKDKATEVYNAMGDKLNNSNFYGMMEDSLGGAIQSLDGQKVNELKDKALNTGKSIVESAKTYISFDSGYSIGDFFMDGFKRGLETGDVGGSHDIGYVSAAIAGRALQRFRDALDEHSPSKETYKIGEFFMQGFVNALKDTSSMDKSIDNMADTSFYTLRSAMDETNSYISENMDLTPVIRPVLDLSGISGQMGAFNSLFNANHMSLYGDMEGTMDATNSDVVESIQTLRGDLADLTRVVGNLKVVMDTGTLVGAIAPSMDNALGAMAAYQERGM